MLNERTQENEALSDDVKSEDLDSSDEDGIVIDEERRPVAGERFCQGSCLWILHPQLTVHKVHKSQ